MPNFGEFLTKRDRDNRIHLRVLGHVFEKAGFKVKPRLDDAQDPYFYVKKPTKAFPSLADLTFGGVRVYARGKDIICFRAQMDSTAEPFGETYQIDIAGMYKDLLDEGDEKMPYLIIYHAIRQVIDFFKAAAKAEAESGESEGELGGMITGGTGTDYSSLATNVKRS